MNSIQQSPRVSPVQENRAASVVDELSQRVSRAGIGTFSIYFAGGLFDLRQLQGNAALARAIEKHSEGKYSVTIPQNVEVREVFDPHQIRDDDFDNVLMSDIFLGQFDGTELDSGTVAEFMRAKNADIPALLVRTDFRGGGDQGVGKDPWNLMLSNFPRCETLCVDSMAAYKKQLGSAVTSEASLKATEAAVDVLAQQIIQKLDNLLQSKPVLPREIQEAVYRGIALSTGFQKDRDEAIAFALQALARKQQKELL